MALSTAPSTPVDYLLHEIARLRAENRKVKRRARWLAESRDRWHRRATRRGL